MTPPCSNAISMGKQAKGIPVFSTHALPPKSACRSEESARSFSPWTVGTMGSRLKPGGAMVEKLQSGTSPEQDPSAKWNLVLRTALALPGAKINRASFLRKELSKHFEAEVVEKAIETRPADAGIPASAIRSMAMGSIKFHRAGVSALSFASGVPGGWRRRYPLSAALYPGVSAGPPFRS